MHKYSFLKLLYVCGMVELVNVNVVHEGREIPFK